MAICSFGVALTDALTRASRGCKGTFYPREEDVEQTQKSPLPSGDLRDKGQSSMSVTPVEDPAKATSLIYKR